MRVFISGTSTDIGKTVICSWLCFHTKYSYFKPIQTGNIQCLDKLTVQNLTNVKIYDEIYSFSQPFSPHLAADFDNDEIDVNRIQLPEERNIIVEGAGGLLVPLNKTSFMIDLIKNFNVPTILVASSKLGTINHTLLSLEALRKRNVPVIGVILNGPNNQNNKTAIEFFGETTVLATFPEVEQVTKNVLSNNILPTELKAIFQ